MTDWKEDTISECVSINPKRELKKNDVAKYLSMADITANQKSVTYYVERKFYGGSKFQNGDTLLARISPCLENGKTAYVDFLKNGEIAWGSTEFIVLSGKDGKSINEFVYYLAKSSALRNVAIRSMSGTSGRQRVQEKLLANEKIAIPPLTEQRSIAKILSDLDAKIEINHQMNKTLEETAQAIFRHWFVDFEFSDENGKPYQSSGGKMVDSELGKIPKGWRVGSIYEISTIIYGASFASQFFNKEKDGLPLIRIRDLRDCNPAFYTTEKHPKCTIIEPGNLVIGMDAEFRPYIWMGERGYLNQRVCTVVPKEKNVSNLFLKFILAEPLAFFERAKQGTTVIHLGKSDIDTFKLVIPTNELFACFSAIADSILNRIVVNSTEIRRLSIIRDSLLPKLMSGKIRITTGRYDG